MIATFCLIITASVLLHWLYRVNKDYYILAFFARRVHTKDGRPVEDIVPIPKGKTIFAHSFDFYGLDDAGTFEYSRKLAKEMGGNYLIYSLGTAVYSIIDPEIIEFVVNNSNLITKGMVYNFMRPALRTGLLTASGQKWHLRRKMITPTFHFNILGQFQEVFKAESRKFIDQFPDRTENIISVTDLIPKFTLNGICETAMGIKLDDMIEQGERYLESIKMVEKLFIMRVSNPMHYNDTMYNWLAASRDAPYLKVMHDFSSEIIAKRRLLLEDELVQRSQNQMPDDDTYINKKRRFAMLDTLICAEKDGLIDHEGICEEVDTLMLGGFDTTSMCLIFVLMLLSLHSEEQERCYQEIVENIDDDLTTLDINQLTKLKYMECVIKETLRLYPSGPTMSRQTLNETELPNGLILPVGTQIVVQIFDLHRNPKYWDNPEKFDPDRFLPENMKDRHTYAFIPFSAGQRNCVGQKYGMVQMKTFLIYIIKQFKILPLFDPKDLILHSGITLGVKNDIKVKLVRRNK
ncbi:cytochrome P450 4p1-like [Drosophila sulfurigaster albostrigata]|uniref:cytochrome P450 4p1-like n=1 Tax=Drosophila sulfurigaster albostrigata TaxID=89887 RepID=UPI002D21BFA6|nr:cytochrome P450 4p1-like [Drosophila sulfurigaster albostrigata]